MAARAIWKGVIRFGDVKVPVKLYASVEDRSTHFRLLHRKDRIPVRQAMINPETDEVVPYEKVRRAFVTDEGDLVLLNDEELETIEPQSSRTIHILQLLPPRAIDHRWYVRPYFLGPDEGGADMYAAFIGALQKEGREALTRWVMRKKEYFGSLRLVAGYPMMTVLRHSHQVASTEDLQLPEGPKLASKEIDMARSLMDMLTADFEPANYRDEYRARVKEMIAVKSSGGKVKKITLRKKPKTDDLQSALEASLRQERKRA
ncbi:MAG TPA: Ku protein [Woeseiaceae bacterium]